MEKTNKKQKGITLIALVITVIVMLIISAVAISAITDPEGIFSQAREAGDNYNRASQNEADELKALLGKLGNEEEDQLPENTQDTAPGTLVKAPEKWTTETVQYVSTQTGVEVTNVTTIQTVYAVAVGNGDTVPVPYGFYYVGGN